MRKQSKSLRDFLQEATTKYAQSLTGSPAEEYLRGRGLRAPSAQKAVDLFRLGYVADPLPGHEMHRGSLAIPYLRYNPENGLVVVSIRFRCIQDHEHHGHGKYMTTAGDRPRLYNTRALLEPSPVIAITEGEIDAITAQLCGIPAVGVPGAKAWKPHFPPAFYGYESVFVFADGDDPGMEFADTVAKTLPNARVIPCPPGQDVNSLVLSQGPKALRERFQ